MTKFTLSAKGEKKGDQSGSPPSTLVDAVDSKPSGFVGIRSYLHQFYQSPTAEDIEAAGAWYLLPPPPVTRTGLYICRLVTLIGLLLLLIGAACIVVGYTWPKERLEESIVKLAIYQDEDGSFYLPRESITHLISDPMHGWKLAGLAIFSTGGILLAMSLLLPTIAQCIGSKRLAGFASGDDTPNEPPIRIYPAGGGKPETISGKKGAKTSPPGGAPVPVMEEVSPVQPAQSAEPGRPAADEMLLAEE